MKRILPLILLLAFATTASAQRAIILQQADGKYIGIAFLPTGAVVLTDVQVLTLPNPTPPPVTAGKRDIAIVHESGLVTEKQASLHVQLRTNQTTTAWMKSRGHRLYILDQDAKDKTGAPSPIVQRFSKAIPAAAKLPVLVILDQSSDAVLYAAELPANSTADSITELVKRHGG